MSIELHWSLDTGMPESRTVTRYCHGCGRTVDFRPSGKFRQNANGKNIYHYEIYKCQRDHTWNNFLGKLPPKEDMELGVLQVPVTQPEYSCQDLVLDDLMEGPHEQVVIRIQSAPPKCRVDKTLAQRIDGCTRSQVQTWIAEGVVSLSTGGCKPSSPLRTGDAVQLDIRQLKRIMGLTL